MGFDVVLYIVSVGDPQRLLARVNQRVREGGHSVPVKRILDRYPRSMANLKKAVRLANLTVIYDAVELDQGAQMLVAVCEKEKVTQMVDKLPGWAATLLDDTQTNKKNI